MPYRSLLLVVALVITSCAPTPPKNVLLIIVDDLGWKDLSVTGSELYQTPRIDELATNGIRFTQFYSDSPVCSPTRAALMTGKHPARLDITNWIGGTQAGQLIQADYNYQLPLEEVTVAERFKEAGYATGFIGKWHLGGEGYFPEDQGFDVNIGGHHAGQPASYFWPYKRENNDNWDVPGLEDGEPGEYLTDRLTNEAVGFMEDHVDEPFFLVLSHYSVHTPIQAKEEMTEAVRQRPGFTEECAAEVFENDPLWSSTRTCQGNAAYAAMVESTDEGVGIIMDSLRLLGLDENTAVVFVSDNGGLSSLNFGRERGPTSNRPLRAGKGYLYEGGTRIPFIVHDPGSASRGLRTDIGSTVDVVPTLLELAGLVGEESESSQFDGRSMIEGPSANIDRPKFFHFPHYHGSGNRPSGSVVSGNYKLIEWFETGDTELYDLSQDEAELNDLSDEVPLLADSLLIVMQEWRDLVGANMPRPNPDWSGE